MQLNYKKWLIESDNEFKLFGYSFCIGISVVLIAALILRLLMFIAFRPWELDFESYELFQFDPQEYHSLAKSLLTGSFDGNTLRTPGYPAFITLIYFIFGIKPWVVFAFQIVSSIVSVYLVYRISRYHFSEKVSLAAAFFLVIDPLQIISPFNFFSEVLFVPFLLVAIYYFIISFDRKSLLNLVFSALSLGVATYIRPISIYLPIILCFIILLSRADKIVKLIKRAVIFCLVFSMVLSPWFVRNLILFDKFEFSVAGGYNLLYVYAAAIVYDRDSCSIDEAIKEVANRVDERMPQSNRNPFLLERVQAEVAKEIIKENIGVFLLNHLTGSINLYYSFSSYRITKMLREDDQLMNSKFYGTGNLTQLKSFVESKSSLSLLVTFLSAVLFTLEYIFAATGVFYLYKRRSYLLIATFMGVILYQTALVGVLGNNARFKLPIEPFYLIFAAYGIQQAYIFWKSRKPSVSAESNSKMENGGQGELPN